MAKARPSRRLKGLVLGSILWAAAGIASAAACGLHAGPSGSLDVAYPGSLSVAVAVAAAKESGRLPDIDPMRSSLAYAMARHRIEVLAARIKAAGAGTDAGGFSIVLVGPRLWTRMTTGMTGLGAQIHVHGPIPGQPVILTDFLVIDAILKDRLSIFDAMAKGLIKVDGDGDRAVTQLLLTALSAPPKTL